jgi:hypothetical protein
MAVGPTALKVAGAAGTLVVCGVSGLAVAADTKPGAAPLKPPISGAATATATAAQTDTTGGLVIPAGGTCAKPAPVAGAPAGATAPPVPAGLQTVASQYAKATTAQQRQQVLAGLTPDQRMQLTAYLQQVAQARQAQAKSPAAGTGGLGLSCLGGGAPGSPALADLNPDVVAGQAGAPISVSAVS